MFTSKVTNWKYVLNKVIIVFQNENTKTSNGKINKPYQQTNI
jgi:hypothetical protein